MGTYSELLSVSVVNLLYPLLFSLFTVISVIALIWLMVRVIGKTDAVRSSDGSTAARERTLNFTALLLIVLVIGLILRLIFVFAVKGYRSDYDTVVDLFSRLEASGFGGDYYVRHGTDVFPLTYYIYSLMGAFANVLGLNTDSTLMSLFVKLPLIAADLATAFVMFKLVKKYVNSAAAVVAAGFICVCPLFVFASGVWATQYSLLLMFLILSLYFLVEKNFVATIGCYAAALLTHKDAMYLFPLFAVFVIYGMVKSCIALRKAGSVEFRDMLKDPTLRPVFTVPVSIVGFLIISYLVSLPLMINSFGGGFFTFIYRIYLHPLASFGLFGHNSLGIFNIFMRNGKALNSRFPTTVFTVIFAVIITAIVLLVYLSKKNRANLVFLGGYIVLTLATYFVGFSEFGLLAAVGIFFMSFFIVRDKRILTVFGLLAVLVTVNASCVMSSAGYYNNLIDYYFTEASGYTGTDILSGGMTAVTIICSALAVLTHLYATVVLLDISMSNKRKVLPYCEDAGLGKAMYEYIKIKNK